MCKLMCKLLDSMFYYIVIVANAIRLITVITRMHKNNIYAELVLKLKMRDFLQKANKLRLNVIF